MDVIVSRSRVDSRGFRHEELEMCLCQLRDINGQFDCISNTKDISNEPSEYCLPS